MKIKLITSSRSIQLI